MVTSQSRSRHYYVYIDFDELVREYPPFPGLLTWESTNDLASRKSGYMNTATSWLRGAVLPANTNIHYATACISETKPVLNVESAIKAIEKQLKKGWLYSGREDSL